MNASADTHVLTDGLLIIAENPLGSAVVSSLLAVWPDALGIYAFGSRVQAGAARPDSDLDLAVLVRGYADPLVLWDAAQALAGQVGCPVDLCDLRAASTVMQYQVLTTGQRLWSHEPDATLWEAFVVSEKHRLDEARAGLIHDIQQRGSIHGR